MDVCWSKTTTAGEESLYGRLTLCLQFKYKFIHICRLSRTFYKLRSSHYAWYLVNNKRCTVSSRRAVCPCLLFKPVCLPRHHALEVTVLRIPVCIYRRYERRIMRTVQFLPEGDLARHAVLPVHKINMASVFRAGLSCTFVQNDHLYYVPRTQVVSLPSAQETCAMYIGMSG
jgi:hypothetical protein